VGWAVGPQINTALVLMALNMALTHREPPAGRIFHSDTDKVNLVKPTSFIANISQFLLRDFFGLKSFYGLP
jgi:transposase InsO family protein